MLEGIEVTSYGKDIPHLGRLATIGGSVAVAAAALTPLTVASANEYGYLCYMRADCTAVGTTAGFWTLKGGGPDLIALQMPVAAAPVGTSYCWPFPVPWKTSLPGNQFAVTPSVATMGTWVFVVNGFYSSI